MSKVYVFLADGFEEIEGLTVVDLLRRAGIETEMVSIMETKQVQGAHGIPVVADSLFDAQDYADAALLVLPGGMPGTTNLGSHEGLCALLKKQDEAHGKIAAICAAPSVLGRLGLLKGRVAACYPGFEDQLEGAVLCGTKVALDDHITTAEGMGAAIDFSLELIGQLTDRETAEKIGAAIRYR